MSSVAFGPPRNSTCKNGPANGSDALYRGHAKAPVLPHRNALALEALTRVGVGQNVKAAPAHRNIACHRLRKIIQAPEGIDGMHRVGQIDGESAKTLWLA